MDFKKVKDLQYLMFTNKYNNCWLNSSMSLIAHNRTLKRVASDLDKSQIKNIISTYESVIAMLNDSDSKISIKEAERKLLSLQDSTLLYLQPKLHLKFGEPDSAFCALLNIFYEKESIKNLLNVSWLWEKNCLNCSKKSKSKKITKPIITFSKVKNFDPVFPTSIYTCSCKTQQEMKLIYKELPPCLFFHFENGAGEAKQLKTRFVIQNRTYHLCGLITLEENSDSSVKHFVTWIRDPITSMWLECNDLNSDLVSFSHKKPELPPNTIYMFIFESLDNLDKISNLTSENIYDQDEDIANELIDISDECPDASSPRNNSCSKLSANIDENLHGSPDSNSVITKTASTPVLSEKNMFYDHVSRSSEHESFSKLNNGKNELGCTALNISFISVENDTSDNSNSENIASEQSTNFNSGSECNFGSDIHLPTDMASKLLSKSYASKCIFDINEDRTVKFDRDNHSEFRSLSLGSVNSSESDLPEINKDHPTVSAASSYSEIYSNNSENDFSEADRDHFSDSVFVSYIKNSASSNSENSLNSESERDQPTASESNPDSPASNFVDRDQEISDLVHNVVETTFASFLEQILIKKGHYQ